MAADSSRDEEKKSTAKLRQYLTTGASEGSFAASQRLNLFFAILNAAQNVQSCSPAGGVLLLDFDNDDGGEQGAFDPFALT